MLKCLQPIEHKCGWSRIAISSYSDPIKIFGERRVHMDFQRIDPLGPYILTWFYFNPIMDT